MRRYFLICIALLGLCGTAHATALQSDITGSGYGALAGTAASKANTGLADLSSGMTLRAFTTAFPGPPSAYSAATGYIESDATNTAVYVQPYRTLTTGDPLVGTDLSTPLNEIWLEVWVYGEWDGSAITTQTTATTPIIGSSPFYRVITYANGAATYTPYGFGFTTQHSASASTRYQFQLASNTAVVHAGWNRWHKLSVRFYQDKTEGGGTPDGAVGKTGIYLNGVLVHESTGEQSQTASGASLKFTMPAVQGVKWCFTGPFKAHSGTSLSVTPAWELDNLPSSLVTRIYQPWNVQTAATNGAYFTSSSTGTVATDTEYAAAASSPYRHRLLFTGSGNTPTVTTNDEIGTLPYDENGWATIVWSDVYCPSGTVARLRLYKTGGTTDLFQYFITGGTLNTYYDSSSSAVGSAPWTVTSRYTVCLHLNRDGRAAGSIFDLTAIFDGTGKQAFSFPLQDWTPQTIGKISMLAIPTASTVEMGYVAVCRRPSFACVDSLSDTVYTPSSGALIHSPINVARSFPYGEETTNIPGAYWPRQIEHETASGASRQNMPRRLVVAPIGRAGKTRLAWTHSILSGMTHTHGIELINFDGGSINDVNTIARNDYVPAVFSVAYNIETMLKWANTNENAVWISTMLPRYHSVAITSSTNANPVVLTTAAHGLTASSTIVQCYVTGVSGAGVGAMAAGTYMTGTGSTGAATAISTTSSTSITLPTVANGGPTVTTTGTGGTLTGFSPEQLTGIDLINGAIRGFVAKYNTKGLITLSDIALDYVNNSSLYPDTGSQVASPVTGFWQDFTHPNGDPYLGTDALRGSGIIAKRMTQLKYRPATPALPRRLSVGEVGRN